MKFLEEVIKKFKYKIECLQTDNGLEFTNRLNVGKRNKKTMFEKTIEELGLEYKIIKPHTKTEWKSRKKS